MDLLSTTNEISIDNIQGAGRAKTEEIEEINFIESKKRVKKVSNSTIRPLKEHNLNRKKLIKGNLISNELFIMNLSMDEINMRIQRELSYEVLEELKDENLMCEYRECISVKNEINKLGKILEKYIDKEVKQKIIEEYLLDLIPAGTKGVIRGNKFNHIVKTYILELELDSERFDICFEKNSHFCFTSEKPDWYILEKTTNKILIGMNQLDIWNGGHQLNRGMKYIINNEYNNEYCKLLCVVCNEIQFKTTRSKAYKIFEIGFQNNTLCYLNHLKNIIFSYFN